MSKKSDPCRRASLLLQKGDETGALRNITRCKKQIKQLIRKKGDPADKNQLRIQLVRALRLEGQIYLGKNSIRKAQSILKEAVKILSNCKKSIEVIQLKGQLEYSLALIATINLEFNQASELFNSSKNNFEKSKQYEMSIESGFRLADIHFKNGEFTSALENYQFIKKLSKKLKDKTIKKNILAKVLFSEGKILRQMDEKKAISLLIKAKKEFYKLNDNENVIQTLIELASFENKNIEKVEEYLLEAFNLTETIESPRLKGIVLTKLGILFLTSGKFEEGQNKLLEGLKYRVEAGDKKGTAQTLLELSKITFLTSRNDQDLSKAIDFARRSYQFFKEVKQEYGMAQTLELLGSINTKLGKLDLANQQISSGRKIFKLFKDRNSEARMLTQLGIILDLQKRREEVHPVLEKALKLYNETKNNQGLAEVNQLLGFIEKDKSRAIEYFKKSRILYNDIIKDNVKLQPILKTLDSKIIELEE